MTVTVTAEQTRRGALAVLLALAAALAIVVLSADGAEVVSGRLGGDYPAFHAAGELVLAEPGLEAAALYDPELQNAEQAKVLPPSEDGRLYFGYPAFYAAPFALLAMLPYDLAYLAYTALMTAALAAAIALVRPMCRLVRDRPVETMAVAVTFYPMFRAVGGGQNTSLTLLLMVGFWRLLRDDRDGAAGLILALLLYKPVFAIPFLGVLVLSRRWRVLGGAAVGTGVLYAVGALVTGPGWVGAWVDAIRYLDRSDTPFNVHNFVSVPGAAEAVFGIDSPAATVVGGLTVIVLGGVISWLWVLERRLPDAGRRGRLDLLVPLTGLGALVMTPHALHYDAGLLLLAAAVLVERGAARPVALAVGWSAGLLALVAEPLGFSPLVALVVLAFALVLRAAWTEIRASPPSEPPAAGLLDPDDPGAMIGR